MDNHCIKLLPQDLELAKKLNVSEEKLQLIYREWQSNNNDYKNVPSEEYVKEKLTPINYEYSEEAHKLWEREFNKDLIYDTIEEANKAFDIATKYFPENAIVKYKTNDGRYLMRVGEPSESVKQIEKKKEIKQKQENNLEESELDKYIKRQNEINSQMYNLYNSELFTSAELGEIATNIVYEVSNILNEVTKDANKVWEFFKKESGIDLNAVKSARNRVELVNAIGVNNLINYVKDLYANGVDAEGNSKYDDFDTQDKADLLSDNWDAIMQLTVSRFNQIEPFTLTKDTVAIEKEKTQSQDTGEGYDTTRDLDGARETQDNQQEAWQVDPKTIDVIEYMTSLVKTSLDGLPELKIVGKDKDGSPITIEVKNEFGGVVHKPLREVAGQMLNWFRGTQDINDMIRVLEYKFQSNPWVKPIIDRLKDTSGKESYFQNEFFTNMYRPFQDFDIQVVDKGGKISVVPANKNNAYKEIKGNIKGLMVLNQHPLFTENGVERSTYNTMLEAYKSLEEISKNPNNFNEDEVAKLVQTVYNTLGNSIDLSYIKLGIKPGNLKSFVKTLAYIAEAVSNHIEDTTYDPFKYNKDAKKSGYIAGNIETLFKPVSDIMEETMLSSFYDSGKMYQSYIIPSYSTILMDKFHTADDNKFIDFISKEYGQYEWFKLPNINGTKGWRHSWLEEMSKNPEARKVFAHKINLNSNKKNYMRNMNHLEYTISIAAEYFSESTQGKNTRVPAWFRVPILSNKPSSEFIRFYSERGFNYQEILTDNFTKVFEQELSRIQTVKMRNFKKGDPDYIKNFDSRGKEFCFLDFLNEDVENGTKLGKLIDKVTNGKELSPEEKANILELIKTRISESLNERFEFILNNWEKNGLLKKMALSINGLNESNVREQLLNMLWNDTYAQIMIQEIFITDAAYYKDADDIQKRIAQIHAPGIRPNIYAKIGTEVVSDGYQRDIVFNDFEDVISYTIDNLKEVFDRKIKNAPANMKKAYEIMRDDVINAYSKINVADAQAYSSPTSYRKKAAMFGKWNDAAEDIYKRLMDGTYNFTNLKTAFQPLKPFKYTQNEESMRVKNAPLSKNKVPVQNKNAEYLLILGDAILRNEKTSKPNLLKVIYDIMEESSTIRDSEGNYVSTRTQGIDTAQFNSAVKSGERGTININRFTETLTEEAINADKDLKALREENKDMSLREFTELACKNEIESLIYNDKASFTYNDSHVNKSEAINYSIQQEVPEHFRNHYQAHGSQERYIVPSDLADTNLDGTPAIYELSTGEKFSKEEIKSDYENTIGENIKEDIESLAEEFKLFNYNTNTDRKKALSKVLQEEINSSSRYGMNLWMACCYNEKIGDLEIPIGESIQSKRIQQLLNSVIKNKVNKQKLPGGPVVQVSSFGVSKKLHMRYSDKLGPKGSVVMTKEEFIEDYNKKNPKGIATDKFNSNDYDILYKKYLKEHQGGFAYMEVLAPIPSEDFFNKFADENGNIDIEAIEAADPDLLFMISNRIPSEDKYSIEVCKIVGFLPREAGEAIMYPYDLTSKDGSDYDVDKRYLQRMQIPLKERDWNDKEGQKGLKTLMTEELTKDYYNFNTTKEEALGILNKKYNNLEGNERNTKLKEIKYTIARNKAKSYVNNYLDGDKTYSTIDKINLRGKDRFREHVDKIYRKYAYISMKPTEGRMFRDNRILDITRTIMQHETNADKALTPGGFEPQKKLGYAIELVKRGAGDLNTLKQMDSKKLKNALGSGDNLIYLDTQIQYYKQNNAASATLGMFAVQKVAHAALEGDNIQVDIAGLFEHDENKSKAININGYIIDNSTLFDRSTNADGEPIGLTFGQLVGASADAAKEPCLNLMNINSQTANVLSTMVKGGIPFETCGIFLSSNVISEMLDRVDKASISTPSTMFKEIQSELESILEEIGEAGKLKDESLTMEEMLESIQNPYENISINTKFKILNYYQMLSSVANEIRSATMATRYNSISNAVGPLIIDNLMMEYDIKQFSNKLSINGKSIGFYDLMNIHPILKQFNRTVGLAQTLFNGMPTNSNTFRGLLDRMTGVGYYSNLADSIYKNRQTLSKFADFFESYMLVASGFINTNKTNYYVNRFVPELISTNFKEKYTNNAFIQALKLKSTDKATYLNVELTGLQESDKEVLSNAWYDLYKDGDNNTKKLAVDLINYFFFRRGIGFSPETGMALFPYQMKQQLSKYADTYRHIPTINNDLFIDLFVRNNAGNNQIVPFIDKSKLDKFKSEETDSGLILSSTDKDLKNKFSKTSYFKFIDTNKNIKLMRQEYTKDGIIFKEISPLGNNGEFLELSLFDIKDSLSNKPFEVSEVEAIEAEGTLSKEQTERAERESRLKEMLDLFSLTSDPVKAVQMWTERLKDSDTVDYNNNLKNAELVVRKQLISQGLDYSKDSINEVIKKLRLC